MADKMTFREFYVSVIAKFGAESEEGVFAQTQIEKMDEKLAARKSTMTAAQKATAEMAEKIFATFEHGVVYTASQIASEFGLSSTSKASAILLKGVKSGILEQTEVKIKACAAQGIKGSKVKGYKLVEASETETEGETEGEGEG